MSESQILLLSLAMVVTGAIGAITGGNSLINVPLMIMVGMSSREAVATNMFAVLFMTVSATDRFDDGFGQLDREARTDCRRDDCRRDARRRDARRRDARRRDARRRDARRRAKTLRIRSIIF